MTVTFFPNPITSYRVNVTIKSHLKTASHKEITKNLRYAWLTILLNTTEHCTQKRETCSWVNEKTDCTSSFLTLVLSFCLWDNHYFNFVCIPSLRFTKIIYKYVSHFLVYLSFGCVYFVVVVQHVHLLYRCMHMCMWICMQVCAPQYGGQRQLLVLSHWSLSILIFLTIPEAHEFGYTGCPKCIRDLPITIPLYPFPVLGLQVCTILSGFSYGF